MINCRQSIVCIFIEEEKIHEFFGNSLFSSQKFMTKTLISEIIC